MKIITTISLLLISIISCAQDTTINYDNLLIGRWVDIKDTRDSKHYPKLNLEKEFKKDGKYIMYQDGKIIYEGNWKIEIKKVKKSIFLVNRMPVLKITEDKLVMLGCECGDYENNCPKKNCYKTTYQRVK